jgi:uncharacterized protein YdaU (DUF1376 family)
MHYYKRNLGDYAKKAGRLTMLQHGAYTLLIDACYDREKFPTLDEAIEWTWASTEAEIEAVKFVLNRFFILDKDNQYVQDRILQELLEYHSKADKNKKIAIEREANRKRINTNRERSVNETPPNQEPITNNHKPRTIKYIPQIPTELLNDYLKLRKAKKLGELTETAFKGIEREALKAGISAEQAIRICCERGWGGFKAEWLNNSTTTSDVKPEWLKDVL